ncbi:MAG: hypothetical protein PVF43_15720, partial [Candidatus Eiseniibacteriota bacterium]
MSSSRSSHASSGPSSSLSPSRSPVAARAAAAAVIVASALAAALVLPPGPALDRLEIAGTTFDRLELRVNDFATSTQASVALDMDARGNVVATWDSRRQDAGRYGICARWIDAGGRLRGPEERVNLERRSMQTRPVVAIDAVPAAGDGADRVHGSAADEAWFAWESFAQDGALGAIVTRRSGAAADKRSNERLLNATRAGDQSHVVIDRLDGGRVAAAWMTDDADGASRIVVRVVADDDLAGDAADGAADGATDRAVTGREHVIAAPAGHDDRLPTIAATGRDGFVVAWARTARLDGAATANAILACRFDAAGEPLDAPFAVSAAGAIAIEPSVDTDGHGRFTIAWLELDPQTDYDVMVRRFDAQGAPLGAPRVASVDRAGWQSGAAVAMAPGGRTAVAWNTLTDDGLDADIVARLFDADGTPLTGDVRLNRHTGGRQQLGAATGVRRLALADDGRLACAWSGDSGQGDRSAACVTLLVPSENGLRGRLALAARRLRDRLAGGTHGTAGDASPAGRTTPPRLAATAAPYVPPRFDPADRGPLLDSESRRVTDRGFGFTAFTNTGWTPPDPHMAAGPVHVMAMVNGGIAVYEKDGTLVWQDDISGGGGFWGEVGATSFVFDPEVIFDRQSQRFMAMANERSTDSRSFFLLGISSTSDPTDPWYKYRLDVTALGGDDIDSPNIAVDSQAIYLTADFFTGGEKYLLYIVDKSSVIDGGTPVTTHYLHTGSQSFGIPVMLTDDAPTMYLIEHFESDPANTVRLWAIGDPLGTPVLAPLTLTVPTYYRPADLRSQGTSEQVLAFDSRFWSCVYVDGSLWAAHHIALTNSPRITVARWYEFDMKGWPFSGQLPELVQSGTVAPPDNVYCSFNSISANAAGDAVMTFARSSLTEYFSIARVFRLADDPPGTMSEPEFVKQSTVPYIRDRWGDYSAVVTDPTDPNLFWMHHEYAAASNSWHTWMASERIGASASIAEGEVGSGADGTAPAAGAVSVLSLAPNPAGGPTRFGFELPAAAATRIDVHGVDGRRVAPLELGMHA